MTFKKLTLFSALAIQAAFATPNLPSEGSVQPGTKAAADSQLECESGVYAALVPLLINHNPALAFCDVHCPLEKEEGKPEYKRGLLPSLPKVPGVSSGGLPVKRGLLPGMPNLGQLDSLVNGKGKEDKEGKEGEEGKEGDEKGYSKDEKESPEEEKDYSEEEKDYPEEEESAAPAEKDAYPVEKRAEMPSKDADLKSAKDAAFKQMEYLPKESLQTLCGCIRKPGKPQAVSNFC